MTIWDNIYKNKKKESATWTTPSERYYSLFEQFLKQSDFKIKHVLDIGCGTGKYLEILQAKGFKTDGLDSSETAVEMTKKILADDSAIICTDMFEFEIPKNKYDLVVSFLTIHHGTKEQVQNLINSIHNAITEDGKIFITVPDFESSKKWDTFKNHQKIAAGTYAPLSGPEKGLAHSFYTKQEVQELFSKFTDLHLNNDDYGNWVVQASK